MVKTVKTAKTNKKQKQNNKARVFILWEAHLGIWLQAFQQTLALFNLCLNEIQTQLFSNFLELAHVILNYLLFLPVSFYTFSIY